MRRIVSNRDRERISKQNKIIALITLGIMIFSIAGFGFFYMQDQQGVSDLQMDYNGYTFVGQSGYWTTQIGNFLFIFSKNPKEVPEIRFNDENILERYLSEDVYIDYVYPEERNELERVLSQLAKSVSPGCVSESDCSQAAPIKNCSNDNVIIIRETGVNSITLQDKCVKITSTSKNTISVIDEFLFKIMEIKR